MKARINRQYDKATPQGAAPTLANFTAFSLGSGATRADTGEDFDSD